MRRSKNHQSYSRIRTQTMRMIRGEEGVIIEYKQSVDAIEQDDLVALANANGGTILVGVKELRRAGRQYGEVIGCEVGEVARRKLLNKAAGCLPPVDIQIIVEGSGRRRILRVEVTEESKKPCCTASGTYKIRKNSTKLAIDPDLMTSIILERESREFLKRFKSAGDAIIRSLEQATALLEEKLVRIEILANEASKAATEAAHSASDAAEAAMDAAASAEDVPAYDVK
ncbi:helix-turn-helix domain-containing protein [Thermoproteota archaeon]